jgi:tricorn protease
VDRVHSRAELSDVLAQLISELGVLHQFVYGGDFRATADNVATATLGARLSRAADGWKVDHVWRADPDDPSRRSPLAAPDVDVPEGSVILRIDGVPTVSVPDPHALLRTKAGRQVLLRVRKPDGKEADAIVSPLSAAQDADLRYLDWEYSRRLKVEADGKGRIGYVHLRAMGTEDYTAFAKGFYPVFNREALIVDVRHNRGGNIDSWLLSRLSRKVWMYWSQRVGSADNWNMQYGFRGHLVVLTDQRTASDGEAFSEGVKRLGLGRVIGMRTWGGEIWLSSDNVLVDNGIATAAEYGVYGPEGGWLIEGRGVEPDEVVDNLPGATWAGQDAQLDAAVKYLQQKLAT